jgi:hypothetical protein
MRSNSGGYSLLVASIAALLFCHDGQAQTDTTDTGWKPNALEIAQLPQYCQGQFRSELRKFPGYTLPQGCGVWINHFCPAIVALNRASQIGAPMKFRVYSLQAAGDHLRYTRGNLQPGCPLAKDLEALEFRERMLKITIK